MTEAATPIDANTPSIDATTAPVYQIDERDNVAIALRQLSAGESIAWRGATLPIRQDVPPSHKIAVAAIAADQPVVKYGWAIGSARRLIEPGEHVHTHNLETRLKGEDPYAYAAAEAAVGDAVSPPGHFMGYRRRDGRVGTRNEIWILCTVGCVANTAQRIAARARLELAGRVDGIHAFTHPFGCSQLGEDLDGTRRIIAGLASHPNAGGVLLIGLGCESNQLGALLHAAPQIDPQRIRSFVAQDEEDEIEAGVRQVRELVLRAEGDRRSSCPLADLVLGLKCGGSDGLSGVTANPLVGAVADRVAAAGGSLLLTEIPELFGADRLLIARAANRHVFDSMVALVNGFKRYFLAHDQLISENPSPGNLAGGITTLEEKSLGAVQKAGRSPVMGVLHYGQPVATRGLSLLEAPGNDAVSSTALVAAGATLILFTTGRGTPLGFPAPTLKIATNSALAHKKSRWIDFDAGRLLTGSGRDELAAELLDLVCSIASGAATRAEDNGEREIAIWKRGVTL
jgi:altronate hydrolase